MDRVSDNAIEIINELHTERLNYESEYLPLITNAAHMKIQAWSQKRQKESAVMWRAAT